MGRLYYRDTEKNIPIFIQGLNEETGDVMFTEYASEARDYGGEYFTNAQLGFLQFHFGEKYPQLKKLKVY